MHRKLTVISFFLFTSVLGYGQAPKPVTLVADLPPEIVAYPQMILFNGKILTVDNSFTVAQALAVRDDRILAVGDTARVLKMAGPQTRVIDLKGKTVVPGLIDTHYHLHEYVTRHMLLEDKDIHWAGKVEMLGIYWKNKETALRDVKLAADAAAPGELVRVPGRNPAVLKDVTRAELDAAAPNAAVIVVSASQLRPFALNTKALEKIQADAKIAPDTPGMPAGNATAITGQAARLLSDYLTWQGVPTDKMLFWHKKIMKRANSWGLTMVETRITPEHFNAVRELWLQGELTIRWRVSFPGPIDFPRTGNVSDIGDDWLRLSGGGGMNAGGAVLGQWTTRRPLVADYGSEDEEGGGSVARWPEVRQTILEPLRYGWSIANSHVKGDIAARAVLDVIEEAQRNPIVKSSNQRFTMDHVPDVLDDDIARMKRLGVIPSSTMRDFFEDDHEEGSSRFQQIFGADAVDKMVPLKKYLEAGIQPTVEADMGDEALGRPLWTVEKAICRCVDGSTRVWGRDQKVSRQDALRMKTIWAAKYYGEEKTLGSLEPGKLADLVVLDGDYMEVPEDKISDLPVNLTIVGGRIAYSTD